jgi:hypothetical protein
MYSSLYRSQLVTDRIEVRLADELGDELGGGRFVDFIRSADLKDFAVVHHRDSVGNGKRLALVMVT